VPGPLPGSFVIKDYVPGGRNVRVNVVGRPGGAVTTFCTADFLGLGAHPQVSAAVATTLDEYSLGSCGPRGFYGTTAKHLELEDAVAGFLGTPESITYSDSVATVASAIPAFAKRGDVLLLDAGVNHAVQTGARLSRSRVLLFSHNDTRDLRAQLEAVRAADVGRRDTSLLQRRFIVVEGLYANSGDICPLREVAALAREFRWRLIVDDSLGFGALGRTGRGITEHHGLATLDVHVLLGSLATSLGSVGGFCVGSREVVDHQRLSGAGYCFSASAPPYLCAAASTAVRLLQEDPGLPGRLATRCVAVHAALAAACGATLELAGDPLSPVKHLRLRADTRGLAQQLARQPRTDSGGGGGGSSPTTAAAAPSPAAAAASPAAGLGDLSAAAARATVAARAVDEAVLAAAAQACLAEGALVGLTRYLPSDALAPRPSLRVCVTLLHTEEELQLLARAVACAAAAVPALLREAASASF